MCVRNTLSKISSKHQASELLGADLQVTAEVRETWEDGRICYPVTPWKSKMEPKNHPTETEDHLPKTSISEVSVFIWVVATQSFCLCSPGTLGKMIQVD